MSLHGLVNSDLFEFFVGVRHCSLIRLYSPQSKICIYSSGCKLEI
jgi:hypothetical protein